jgi:hypothetical protein
MYTGGNEEPCDGSLECCLDFNETAPYTAAQRSLLMNSTVQQVIFRTYSTYLSITAHFFIDHHNLITVLSLIFMLHVYISTTGYGY